MASGTYISIDKNLIPTAAERARNLRNHMESTRTSLRVYQQQLNVYVQSMERRFGFCFNDTVPLNALAEQERRMRTLADLFDKAAELVLNNMIPDGKTQIAVLKTALLLKSGKI